VNLRVDVLAAARVCSRLVCYHAAVVGPLSARYPPPPRRMKSRYMQRPEELSSGLHSFGVAAVMLQQRRVDGRKAALRSNLTRIRTRATILGYLTGNEGHCMGDRVPIDPNVTHDRRH